MGHLSLIKSGVAIVVFVFLLNIILFLGARVVPAQVRNIDADEIPRLFISEPNYWSKLSDFAVCGSHLYVLFEDKQVLACYDLQGNYLHSYYVPMGQNGKPHLYVKEETLYTESRDHKFYVFQDGVFTELYAPDLKSLSQWRTLLSSESQDIHQLSPDEYYELRGASIWRVSENVEERILHRGMLLVLFQSDNQLLIHLVCVVLFFLIYLVHRKSG